MYPQKKLESEISSLLFDRNEDEKNAFYFYSYLSNWCKNNGYFKASEFFKKESLTELEHSAIIEKYLTDWNIMPEYKSIQSIDLKLNTLVDCIVAALDTEYSLYEDYEDTAAKVMKLGDVCTFNFLLPFNKIQQESVAEYSDMLNMLEGVEATKFNLLLLEKKLF